MPSTIQSTKALNEINNAELILPARVGLRARWRDIYSPQTVENVARRRSLERYRRITLTAFTSLGAKGITLLTAVVVVPLTFRYLGPERYGLWMTITSFVLFLGFADLGIGNGLTARVAESHGRENQAEAAKCVSCAFYFLLPLSAVLMLAFAGVFHHISWQSVYGVKSPLALREAGWATAVLLVCSALNMPLGTALRVELGYQEGFLADIWNASGSLLALVGILFVVRHGGGLTQLVLAVAGFPLVVNAVNWIAQFWLIRPGLRPKISLFDIATARQLFAIGGLFFVQQCFGLIYYLSDNIVIARTMGASEVARYAVLQRIFSIGLITQYLVAPLWPAISEAVARHDLQWAASTARRAIVGILLLGSTCSILLLIASRYLMKRWSGMDPGPIDSLRIGFAVWVVLVGYIATMNALLNQRGVMRLHVVIFGVASLTSLALKVFFANHGSVAGVIWATNIGFGVIYVIPAAILSLRTLSIRNLEPSR